jgi:hypothetical protein
LPHDGALEGDKHEEGKEGIIPILVKHPQTDTEDLENEKGSNSMFLKELGEGRYGDIEGVRAVILLEPSQFSLCSDAFTLLEFLKEGFRFGIDFVGQRTERLLDRVVEKAALLEQEG